MVHSFPTRRSSDLVPSSGALRDVSPEYPLDQLHEPFHYALRPGQGIVIVGPSA